jgi:diguanylate cyclase (GGDEF)-like protein
MVGSGRKESTRGERLTLGGRIEEMLARWARRIASAPASARYVLAVLGVGNVALLDHLTGAEISFSVFYLLPVSFAAWFISRRAGWTVAVVSAGVWGYLDIATGHGYAAAWIPYWNSAVRFGFFVLVTELINRLRAAHFRERALSRTDSLTGIANARVFEEYAGRTIAQSRRSHDPFSITYVDLDFFKLVNDEFGHSEGDKVLRAVAGVIADNVRETDIVARLGGDEFAILMPETRADEAHVTLERVAAALSDEIRERWAVGATFGTVTFVSPPPDVDSAVRQADALMYQGKEAGRGRIVEATWPTAPGDDDSPA